MMHKHQETARNRQILGVLPKRLKTVMMASAVLLAAHSVRPDISYAEQCSQTTNYNYGNSGGVNTLDVLTVKSNAVLFDAGQAALRLNYVGGQFSLANYSVQSAMVFAASADFNKDGFADYVAAPLCQRNTTCNGFNNNSVSSVYLHMNTTYETTKRVKLTAGSCGTAGATYGEVTEAAGTPWTQFSTGTLSCTVNGSTSTIKNYEDSKQYLIPDFNHGSANTTATDTGFALPYPGSTTEPAHSGTVVRNLVTGDYNGDTWPDVAVIATSDYKIAGQSHHGGFLYAKIWLNRGATCGASTTNIRLCTDGQSRFLPAYDALAAGFPTGNLNYIGWGAQATAAGNFNNEDAFADLLIGVNHAGNTAGVTGKVAKLLNNTQQPQPQFVFNQYLQFTVNGTTSENIFAAGDAYSGVSGDNYRGRVPVIAVHDLNGDGKQDLLVGGPAIKGLKSFSGTSTFPSTFIYDSNQPIDVGVETNFETNASVCALSASYLNVACTDFGNSNRRQGYSLFSGAVTGIAVADVDLDGKPDVIVATDGAVGGIERAYGKTGTSPTAANRRDGGQIFLFSNTNTAPGMTSLSQAKSLTAVPRTTATNYDMDVMLVMDYDKLNGTPDIIAYDGNNSATTMFVPNRVQGTTYPECGWATSAEIDLSSIGADEYAARRVELTATGIGLTVDSQFQLWITSDSINGVNPQNPIATGTWVKATYGTGPLPAGNGCTAGKFCADLPNIAGRDIGWAARFCSYDNLTKTPKLESLQMDFTFEESSEVIRGGTIESGGMLYQGSYTTPGMRGKLYAIRSNFTGDEAEDLQWEASAKLNSRADPRAMFTASAAPPSPTSNPGYLHSSPLTRMNFDDATIGPFYSYLGVSDQAMAVTVATWMRSKRFGVAGEKSALGAIAESTPAIMVPPSLPPWLTSGAVPDETVTKFTSFQQSKQQRPTQLLVGSMSGALHSFHLRTPSNASQNGYEAWAYVPTEVLTGAYGDCIASSAASPKVCAAVQGSVEPSISRFVGGSPTIGDVLDPTTASLFQTSVIVGTGSGGKTYSALDLSTSDGFDSVPTGWVPGDAVPGPRAKWQFDPTYDFSIPASTFPGEPVEWIQFFGWATHKAVFARVSIAAKKSFVDSGGTGPYSAAALDTSVIQDPFICKERTSAGGAVINTPAGPNGDMTYYNPGEREETIVILSGANFPQDLGDGAPVTGHPKTVAGGSVPPGETPMESEVDQWWQLNEGRGVTARRVSDGKTMWRFLTICPISSDPVLFTQTEADQIARGVGGNGPTVPVGGSSQPERWRGYVNRMVIFDSCGYGYLINPSVEIEMDNAYARVNPWFAWLNHPSHNTDIGVVAGVRSPNCNGAVDPAEWGTWFATGREFGALKAVSGTIGALRMVTDTAPDGKTFIFVGTGGVNSAGKDEGGGNTNLNYIYALDAAGDMGSATVVGSGGVPTNGSIAAPFTNTTNPVVHTKVGLLDSVNNLAFRSFGGIVVSQTQAIFSVSVAHQGCNDAGKSKLIAMNLSNGVDDPFATTTSATMTGAVYGSIYGSGNALYFGTVAGDVKRIGEAAGGAGGGNGNGGYEGNGGFTMFGWRQVF